MTQDELKLFFQSTLKATDALMQHLSKLHTRVAQTLPLPDNATAGDCVTAAVLMVLMGMLQDGNPSGGLGQVLHAGRLLSQCDLHYRSDIADGFRQLLAELRLDSVSTEGT